MADATCRVHDDLAKAICRRALLTPEEVIKEILLEKNDLRRHQKSEEDRIDRIDRIKQPWPQEIKTPITDRPDINYRKLIIDDQETIDELLENRALHFVERIEEYRRQDTSLEVEILGKYQDWIQSMKDHGANIENKAHEDFLQGLQDEVKEDFRLVSKEWSQRWLVSQERRTPKEGVTDILGGVAGCPCDKCDGLRMQSVAEKERRHWALLEEQRLQGRSNFERGTPISGCDCGQCKWASKRTKNHDDKESLERSKGNIDLSNGIPGCDCDECEFRQLKRHKKLRMDEWINGFVAGAILSNYFVAALVIFAINGHHYRSINGLPAEIYLAFVKTKPFPTTLALAIRQRLSRANPHIHQSHRLQFLSMDFLPYLQRPEHQPPRGE